MPIPKSDPIVVAPTPTPFSASDQVDHNALGRNIERWLATDLHGFVLNSENGEESFLSEIERLDIVRTVNAARSGKKFILAGVDSPSTTETIRLSEALADAGAEMIRVRIPRLTDDIAEYFREVVPRIPVPVVIINQPAPGMFGQSLQMSASSPEVISEALAMDNVFGYIMGGQIREAVLLAPKMRDGLRFWGSNGVLLLAQGAIGANGACLMLGNVAPSQCIDLLGLTMSGRLGDARRLHSRLVELDRRILSRGAAGIKGALSILGFDGFNPRRPSQPLAESELAGIRSALENAGFIDS